MRRRHIIRVVAALACVFGTTLALASALNGPVPHRTGAISLGGVAAEPNCTACHSSWPANDGTGQVQILDLPEHYNEGDTVTFRVQLSRTTPPETELPKWGFQMTAITRNYGQGAGTWLPTLTPQLDSLQVKLPTNPNGIWKTRRYLEHTWFSTRTGQRDQAEWTVQWIAPSKDSGAVYFFAAGNAANGDGTSLPPSDDHIFTTSDSILPFDGTVSVPGPGPITYVTFLNAPYPNPFHHCSDLSFEIASEGWVDLALFDLAGRRVRTLVRGWREKGPGAAFWDGRRDDGQFARNGVYFARLAAPGLAKPLTRKVTLSR